MGEIKSFRANDGIELFYHIYGDHNLSPLILIHGYSGSARVWRRNVQDLSRHYRLYVPDLRGHGDSKCTTHGYHVSRLAMDLHELVTYEGLHGRAVRAVGSSMGCSILWCYAELFSTRPFSHMIFVDQSPLQYLTLDGWDQRYSAAGMNNPQALAALQTTLAMNAAVAHRGTVAACLAYRSHPRATDPIRTGSREADEDENFFLSEALRADPVWLGRLMADHGALDWRHSISETFGGPHTSRCDVLVVASQRSGCFPEAGPLTVVNLIRSASGDQFKSITAGVTIDWGGHWCYWENPIKFNSLVLDFFGEPKDH